MMRERGVNVDHTTIYRWVQHYGPEIEKRIRRYTYDSHCGSCDELDNLKEYDIKISHDPL